MLILFVVGDILGAGIYARVGAVAGEVGGAIWTSFVLGIGIAALTALAYGELARVEHRHFSIPAWIPALGAVTCLILMTQFTADVYLRAVVLVTIGLALCGINFLVSRRLETKPVPRQLT